MRQGLTGSAWLLVPVFGIPVVRLLIARSSRLASSRLRARSPGALRRGRLLRLPDAGRGVFAAGYLIGRCGAIDFYTMRYELLSVVGAVGLAGWYLRTERSRVLAAVWSLCCAAVFAVSLTAHVRLIAEYATHPPVPLKQELIRALDARNIRYAYADFWTSYYVSFMTRERIIVASDDAVKVRTYNRLVDAHRAEAIRISRRPCQGGEPLTPQFWGCVP